MMLAYAIFTSRCDHMVVLVDEEGSPTNAYHNGSVVMGDTELTDLLATRMVVGYDAYPRYDKVLHKIARGVRPHVVDAYRRTLERGDKVTVLGSDIDSLDPSQQIAKSKPSLSRLMGNDGSRIDDLSDLAGAEKALERDDLRRVFDALVDQARFTWKLYRLRQRTYFEPKRILLDLLDGEGSMTWNTTTLATRLLTKTPIERSNRLLVGDDVLGLVPPAVKLMWHAKERGKVVDRLGDCQLEFGFGGLHGTNDRVRVARNVRLLDVTSMYPNIVKKLRLLGDSDELYGELLNRRLAVKDTDESLGDALKLVVNAVVGNLKNPYSDLYNPMASVSVAAYGQCVLYELGRRLEPYTTIIQYNTDGIALVDNGVDIGDIIALWEEDFGLTLTDKRFDLFIQRDVNNYIAVTPSGDVVAKGGDVSRYNDDPLGFTKNGSLRILDKVIVEHLIHGTDVLDALMDNLDKPELFQYILDGGRDDVVDRDGTPHPKVNRVFASKRGDVQLLKRREDGSVIRFPDAPERMLLWNDACDTLHDFKQHVDLNHYYKLATRRLERWTTYYDGTISGV